MTTNLHSKDTLPQPTLTFTAWHLGWVLMVIGLAVSAYLSYSTLAHTELQCIDAAGFDCAAVQRSAWSKLGGVPVAWLGLGTYVTMALIWFLEKRAAFFHKHGLLLLFALGLIGWLFSLWLAYVQIAIIGALCQWCLIHEINFTLLFGVIVFRLWQSMKPETR